MKLKKLYTTAIAFFILSITYAQDVTLIKKTSPFYQEEYYALKSDTAIKQGSYIRKHKDYIIKTFGKPYRISSDNYNYNYENLSVNFICYDFDDHLCSSIEVVY